ncbi:reprolysin-like metallopeptidase [Streptomyces sp. NPDC051567]|uniref:reprolysin-like metallopeptidase n=1 Tax=Streptomyces sp. NPDC051567 TaxID=3365660 RepID=UPI0037BAD6CD
MGLLGSDGRQMVRRSRAAAGLAVLLTLAAALPTATATATATGAGDANSTGRSGTGVLPGLVRSGDLAWSADSFAGLCRTRQGAAADRRTLPLLHGVSVDVVADTISQDGDGTLLWSGHVYGKPDRSVTLAVNGACGSGARAVAGFVAAGRLRYAIEPGSHGTTVREFDTVAEAPLARDSLRLPERPGFTPGAQARAVVTDPVVTVLIGYTPATVKATDGGAAALDLRVKATVAAVNQAFADSQVKARLKLLGTFTTDAWSGEVSDTGGMAAALGDPNDKRYSSTWATGVRKTRDQKGADLVHVLTAFTPQAGTTYTVGTGSTPSLPRMLPAEDAKYSSDGAAFGAQQANTLSPYHLAHEIGHNFGLNHDYVTDPIDPADKDYHSSNFNPYYPDNHGFLPAARDWTDIMGYPSSCADPNTCEAKLWYSNPRQDFDGRPRGVALGDPMPADCVRVMNLTAPVLAQYRAVPGQSAPARYALTAVADSGQGGSVDVPATGLYDKGDQVTATARPDDGYKLDKWAIDGVTQPGRNNQITVTMNDNHFVTATYIKDTDAYSAGVPAQVDRIDPAQASAAGGVTATIHGSALTGTSAVYVGTPTPGGFSGRPAGDVTVVDDNTVRFTVPAWPGPAQVTVALVSGAGVISPGIAFTYTP